MPNSVTVTWMLYLACWGVTRWGGAGRVWVHLVCLLLYRPWMMDDDMRGPVDGMKIGRGTCRARRKPAPLPLCQHQIPHDNLGSNPGRRGWKPVTNRLSLDAAYSDLTNTNG
jgi:hypothetical protein